MLEVVRAQQAAWEDVTAVFGARGTSSRCFCQRYRLQPRESFATLPAEVCAERLHEQVAAGAGLLAYDHGVPVGWVAVAPRSSYDGLVRNQRVPWVGRDEDRDDPSVWAITCVLVRAGHRRRGLSGELVRAAVAHARDEGARAVEAYPMTTTRVIDEELHVGTLRSYLEAGLVELARPTLRRAVCRLDL